MEQPTRSRCPICGERAIIRSAEPIEVETKDYHVWVEGLEYDHCTACGEDYYTARQSDEILLAAAAKARDADGLLSPAEVRELRLSLGLTQTDLESLMGVGKKVVGNWERGLYAQSKMADRFLRILAAHPELIPETGFVAAEGRGPYGRKRASKPKADR